MGTKTRKGNGFSVERFNNPIDRYQSLRIKECLAKPSQYFLACKELCFLLKNAYPKFPKNLQSLIFQDTVFAFNLLPEMQTQSAISAAISLLQSAEFALPKQKRALAVKEYKHAVVASKRKSRINKEEEEEEEEEEAVAQLPQDVLVHMFSFLDVQSLLSASAVCWSWKAVSGDKYLWKLLYDTYFCKFNDVMKNKRLGTIGLTESEIPQNDNRTVCDVDYRFAFETAYKDARYRKFGYHRGYCSSCCSIVWVSCNRCSNENNRRDEVNHQIKPVSVEQIVEFILDGFASSESSSDSDSDTEVMFVGMWAYPRNIS